MYNTENEDNGENHKSHLPIGNNVRPIHICLQCLTIHYYDMFYYD